MVLLFVPRIEGAKICPNIIVAVAKTATAAIFKIIFFIGSRAAIELRLHRSQISDGGP